MGTSCGVGTCFPGPLGMSVFLCRMGDNQSRGGASMPLTSHEGEHTERNGRKESVISENDVNRVKLT